MARTTIMNKSNHISEKHYVAIDTYKNVRVAAGAMIIQPLLNLKKYKALKGKEISKA